MRKAFPPDVPGYGLALDDYTFLRYLRARSFDLTKATAMLTATLKWRNEFGLVNMMSEWTTTIQLENSTGKMFARGFSKDGHALLYMKPRFENTLSHDGNMVRPLYSSYPPLPLNLSFPFQCAALFGFLPVIPGKFGTSPLSHFNLPISIPPDYLPSSLFLAIPPHHSGSIWCIPWSHAHA